MISHAIDMHPLFAGLDPRVDLEEYAQRIGFEPRLVAPTQAPGDDPAAVLAAWPADRDAPDHYLYGGKFLRRGQPLALCLKPLRPGAVASWLQGNALQARRAQS